MPPQYDSLLAKLVASGASRAEALARLRGALARCEIGGVATTLPLHAALAGDAEFAAGVCHGVPRTVAGVGYPLR